ncbi:MAG: nucleotide exchange factor GrpE [Caldilineaceae bacterium]
MQHENSELTPEPTAPQSVGDAPVSADGSGSAIEMPVSEGAGAGGAADDNAAGGPTAEQQIAQMRAELAAEQARYAELTDRYQRAAAEFQNTRRRLEKQMAEAIDRASTHVIRRLLPVLDDCDLAFRNVPAGLTEEHGAWVEGFRAIQKKLLTVLDDEGVKVMADSGPFDPNRHEAVSSEPNESVASGHIIATLRPGYESNGTVIRPSLVRVSQ